MQIVSDAYKQSMNAPLRNRGYISVSFGIFNESVQNRARFIKSSLIYAIYSNDSRVFYDQTDDFVYATMESNFFKVDGSQHFLPQVPLNENSSEFENTGIVSQNTVPLGNVAMDIRLPGNASWYGLTVNFGENYPVSFDLIYGNNTLEVRDNDKAIFIADQAFNDVDQLRFVFYQMKTAAARVRIYNIKFGIGYVFENKDILNSTLTRNISPISEYLPQFDFSVTLKNPDRYFDVDNPNSAINFLSSDIYPTVQYGYELDNGKIEWLPGQTLRCVEWESDEFSATIRCQDVLRSLNSEYLGGTYDPDGKTYAELAEIVLESAGITSYYLDPVLSEYTTHLPIPRLQHKEALQLIANACCCIMTFARDGTLEIRRPDYSILLGDFRMTKRDMTSYPKAEKKNPIKEIIVDYQRWRKDQSERSILSEEITVTANEERTYYFAEPIYDYRVTIDGVDMQSAIVASGDYYLTLRFQFGGDIAVDIFGKNYTISKYQHKHSLGDHGEVLQWTNPIIDSIFVVIDLTLWLTDYYSNTISYEYDTRGHPELDAGDVIWQYNLHDPLAKVILADYRFDFSGSFSGHVITKRIGGS